jgi:hypothetical protein
MGSTATAHKLPFLGLDTKTINSKDLQTIGSRVLDEIHTSGDPKIVSVKERRAVLVDYDQYARMQESFQKLFNIVSDFLIIQRTTSLSENSKEQMEEVFYQVRDLLPDNSPIGIYFDRLLQIAETYFSSSETIPSEAAKRMQTKLAASGKKVTKKNGSLSRRPYHEENI